MKESLGVLNGRPYQHLQRKYHTGVKNNTCERGTLRVVEILSCCGKRYSPELVAFAFTKFHETPLATRDQPRHFVKDLCPNGKWTSRNLVLRSFSEEGDLSFLNSDPSSQTSPEISLKVVKQMHGAS